MMQASLIDPALIPQIAPQIELRNLSKKFGPLDVLKSISLQRDEGSITAILGPSGSGKSTLLRMMNLLVIPSGGSMRIGDAAYQFDKGGRSGGSGAGAPRGRELARFRQNTGMVFQHFNLFAHMNVLQNVMEGPRIVKKMPLKTCEEIARDLLSKVGLADKAYEHPSRLSGGQKQRVAIARALAMQPKVMLFDEVTSALDPELVGEVLSVIRGLAAEGMTMLLVTHEIGFARDVADTVIFMRDGFIVEDGPAADVISHPSREETRNFLKHFHERR